MDEPGLINLAPLVHIGNKGCDTASLRRRIIIQFLSLVTRPNDDNNNCRHESAHILAVRKKKRKTLTAHVAHTDGKKHTFRDVMIGWPSHCPPG